MTVFHCSPFPPVAGRWLEVRYRGPGDVLFWRVTKSDGSQRRCAFNTAELDGYGTTRLRVPFSALELYVMDWDSRRAAPPLAGEGQVRLSVVKDARL